MNRTLQCQSIALVLLVPAIALADDSTVRTQTSWGTIAIAQHGFELDVTSVPDDRVVAVPRFHSPYKRIYLKSDDQKAQLKFVAEVKEWLVTIPEAAGDSATVIVETVGRPQWLKSPHLHEADKKKGVYLLPAHLAVVHGDKLRYEPQPHKNTIGYWTVETDWCEWQLNATQPGKYKVHVLQGCGKGHGGSKAQIRVGDSHLIFTVEDTGHFQNFKDREVGTLEITRTGKQSIQIRPLSKANIAVMDIRQVRLTPLP
jgi:hypothetical protein